MAVAAVEDHGKGRLAEEPFDAEVTDFRRIPLGQRAEGAARAALGGAMWLARHWLALANGFFLALLGGSALPPMLMAAGVPGMASPLFSAYGALCHQLPYRSFSLLGYQMAICERDVAIYGSLAFAGLLFGLARERLDPLPWRWYFALLLPLAIDGSTQALGLRESTWELRLITGSLFGTATALLAYPHLNGFTAQVLAENER